MLDFIKFINDNVSLTSAQKQALLDDFCSAFNYDEIPEAESPSKKDFANQIISNFIVSHINDYRRRKEAEKISIEELEL